MIVRGDAHGSCRLLIQGAQSHLLAVECAQHWLQGAKQTYSSLCKRHAARGVRQQSDSQPCFQRRYGMTQPGT
ncbi:hypothetical protein ACJ2_25820 [Pantoea sp. QMID2]|nr:hypothetical protein ACJ1_29310 [Pantoea sp. QMID1]GME42022.1 hypothetical protein ACJ3_29410 [Pantoea sp. QMID3]GME57270.1 hypothetical protein ACJ4_25810 [Pantoea sp. QMID4]GME58501.1 hypothetical protein ACJ2_25820 [Pantoea sp. QMID2]